MTFYIKLVGYNSFYRVSGTVRRSNKGYRILTIETVEPVTKYHYYNKAAPCFSWLNKPLPGYEIHEIAYCFLPWPKD